MFQSGELFTLAGLGRVARSAWLMRVNPTDAELWNERSALKLSLLGIVPDQFHFFTRVLFKSFMRHTTMEHSVGVCQEITPIRPQRCLIAAWLIASVQFEMTTHFDGVIATNPKHFCLNFSILFKNLKLTPRFMFKTIWVRRLYPFQR